MNTTSSISSGIKTRRRRQELFTTYGVLLRIPKESFMPRGDKSSYTGKQKRQAEHIEEGYERRGVSSDEAERRAWATVNAETHGGKKSGSGRGKKENRAPSRKGGKLGGKAAAKRPAAERSRSAKKAAQTRKRRAA
jgi:plasmid stabilization system protein ParE